MTEAELSQIQQHKADAKNNRAGVIAAVGDFLAGKSKRAKDGATGLKAETTNLWQAKE